ncbi:ASCH domain-containing protein [Vibrio mediterranei]|uniref:ASCH domain-containing protein n=1 Tax=Vibrio mediterranei TaxID=689 RepID=UPI00148B5AB1|nr:ASCH domain-containing protein [Vibrio mediterranei]MCG9628048.1 ASCH domain-containing protein [Vibrio mediterranei]NOI24095.1 ASCH domain-containing protein [Vibrio mediterranei]
MTPKQQIFLNQYLEQLTTSERASIKDVIAEHFCGDEYNANQCAKLINEGIKTASCSLKAGYEIEQEPLPQVGRLSVVLDWDQNPICIIKLTSVEVCPFNQVSEAFAYAEGEGDRTYQWWKQAHLRFFEWYANELNITFSEYDDLVLERFEKVFPR